MDMIERVARAICKEQFGSIEDHGDARCCQVGGVDGCCVHELFPEARAAIEAMTGGALKTAEGDR